jgi:hypothetical protein
MSDRLYPFTAPVFISAKLPKATGITGWIKPYQRPAFFEFFPYFNTSPLLIMAFSMHSHSGQFCPGHAKDTLEEVVQSAISHGMQTFALTEHMPRDSDDDMYPDEVYFLPLYYLSLNLG